MPRFFVPKKNITADNGIIAGQELNHLRKVLRLRPGDEVTLFDGEGWEYTGTVQAYTARAAEIKIVKSYQPDRESPLEVTLAQAIPKGEKMDWLVEKATELGVGAIMPFLSERTVPKLDKEKTSKRQARWKKIAQSAAEQSGRTRVPKIFDVCHFGDLIRQPWKDELTMLFWERESVQRLSQVRKEIAAPDSVILIIGPEGGFNEEEASEASNQGIKIVCLGKRILRTETAALAALSIVQSMWGDMG